MPTVDCCICGKTRQIAPSHLARLKHPTRATCSEVCRAKARLGRHHWNWRGGRRIDAQGYVRVLPKKRRERRGKVDPYIYEQVAVAEEHLGRRLRPDERVVHKDGDKQNNRWSNLKVIKIRLAQTSAQKRRGRMRHVPDV
jgi:hypothetical protein